MSIEHSHGKARPTLPRLRDVAVEAAERQRGGNRDAKGRFVAGNGIGTGRGWKAIIARHLGRELKGEAEPIAREAFRLYRAELGQLPYDGPQVRQLTAARARSAALAARYALRAAELGLDTDDGMRALQLSMQLDARAERLAVTALDLATKLAAADRARLASAHPLHMQILNAGSTPKEPTP